MAEKITPQQAHADLASGALLVCGYDSDEKFRANRLAGAISLAEFRSRESSLPRDREVVFYCA